MATMATANNNSIFFPMLPPFEDYPITQIR